jgi:hypothetical protein
VAGYILTLSPFSLSPPFCKRKGGREKKSVIPASFGGWINIKQIIDYLASLFSWLKLNGKIENQKTNTMIYITLGSNGSNRAWENRVEYSSLTLNLLVEEKEKYFL